MDLAKQHMGRIDLGTNTWYETWKHVDLNIKNIGKKRSKHRKHGIKHKACRSRQLTHKQAWKTIDLN